MPWRETRVPAWFALEAVEAGAGLPLQLGKGPPGKFPRTEVETGLGAVLVAWREFRLPRRPAVTTVGACTTWLLALSYSRRLAGQLGCCEGPRQREYRG